MSTGTQRAPLPNPGHDYPRITLADTRPGDVMLSRGQDPISDFVARLDGGIYSHSALWTGEKVLEATTKGVLGRPFSADLEEQAYIDVYRWKSMGGEHRLGDKGYPVDPIVDYGVGLTQKDFSYGWDELIMGALVVGLSKMPEDPALRIAIRLLGDLIDPLVHKVAEKGKAPGMVCSQVVTESFWEATDDHRYAIHVTIDGSRHGPGSIYWDGPHSDEEEAYAEAAKKLGALVTHFLPDLSEDSLEAYHVAQKEADETMKPVTAPVGGPLVPTGLVTIRELQDSPNLELIGRLSDKPLKRYPSIEFDIAEMFKPLVEEKLKSWMDHLLGPGSSDEGASSGS